SRIGYLTRRVQTFSSISEKSERKLRPLNRFEKDSPDNAGIRVVCQFVDDISTVVDLLRKRKDLNIIEEKDYIFEKKVSGYRSFHQTIEYPVETIHGVKMVIAEIQIRTLAMNFWATNEHFLNYKYKGRIPEQIKSRLKRAAEAAF